MDRMRQSLFSILGNLEGTSFLDLFSGTGILGIEAASRGADPVLLVEKDARKKKTILKNISFVETHIDLVVAPVERFLRTNTRSWDIVFLDPPFDREGKGLVLDEACGRPTSRRGPGDHPPAFRGEACHREGRAGARGPPGVWAVAPPVFPTHGGCGTRPGAPGG